MRKPSAPPPVKPGFWTGVAWGFVLDIFLALAIVLIFLMYFAYAAGWVL